MDKSPQQTSTSAKAAQLDEEVFIPRSVRKISYNQQGNPQLSIYGQLGVMLWLSLFFVLFYAFYLPNNSTISRLNIWELLLDLYLENIFPTADGSDSPPSSSYKGWHFFPERLPIFGMMFVILLSAWGYGIAAFKLLRLSDQLSFAEKQGGGLAVGLGLLSLITLCFGYAGMLNRLLMLVTILTPAMVELISHRKDYVHWLTAPFKQLRSTVQFKIPVVELVIGLTMFLFLWTMLLGAVLPETDFDVREYHLQGPKEFFQQGQIMMLKHNVYTSFPFLTEMLSLLSMVLMNDWFYGSLVAKGVLMLFAPISALLIFGLARRVCSYEAGIFGALIFLSTPWVYRISIIAYTEGALCCYTIAALWASTRTIKILLQRYGVKSDGMEQPATLKIDLAQLFSWTVLTGFLSGCAVSTKYPGLVTVTIPLCAVVMLVNLQQVRKFFKLESSADEGHSFKPFVISALGLLLGISLGFGPWVIKNVYETGNPVYPLMYGVFGGEDLTPELVAKWKKGHAPDHYHLTDLGMKIMDVTVKSDWQSPLVFSLLPLACIIPTRHRKLAIIYALYVVWYFAVWWVCTHRLDRFWVPLLPVACLVAGIGYSVLSGVARFHASGLMLAAIVFNLGFITSTLCGNNSYLHGYTQSRELFAVKSISKLEPLMQNQKGCVLSVGEAQVFDARYPVIYNTVFDESIFERWCTTARPNASNTDWILRDPAEIKKFFAENKVKYILVNWQEILRYRETYGYTKFVTPKRFIWLQEQGIIGNSIDLSANGDYNFRKLDSFRADTGEMIQLEMPELLSTFRRSLRVKLVEYYPVLSTPNPEEQVK